MAGAPLTGYDVLSSTPVEAMKKPSRAGGGEPSKARSRRSSRLKRNIESKATAPRSTATQQLGEWLGILGMSEYAERFAENDVDLSVLPHLTDHDLKELGVSLGHRRKMLAAIAERTGTVDKILGTPRRSEHGAALARSGETG
jgi:SAM domain (Sterile alpha motif)